MYTNNLKLPLSVATWLAVDHYDYNQDPTVISATTLLKPTRAIVLERQMEKPKKIDVSDLFGSRIGTSIHDAIEKVWLGNPQEAMRNLGEPKSVVENIVVNPPNPKTVVWPSIPVYLEQRGERKVGNWTITGKFDFCIAGQLEDFKSTSVWSWVFQSNRDDYIKQGSIYKFLFPEIITEDTIGINYVFTDWAASKARHDKGYPSQRIMQQKYPLMSPEETEQFIRGRLRAIESAMDQSQDQMPLCTKEELWQKDSTWKYYKDATKTTGRSTKNYDNPGEARARATKDGGVVIEQKAEVKRCLYCNARPSCLQADKLKLEGLLKEN